MRRAVVASVLLFALVASAAPIGAAVAEEKPRLVSRGVSVAGRSDYWTARKMRGARPAAVSFAPTSVGSAAPTRSSAPAGGVDDVAPTAERALDGAPSFAPAASQEGAIPFDRYEVADTQSTPFRTHGKVFFSASGLNYVCSGTAVNSANMSVVITAGHCVHEGGTGGDWHRNWAFVPGYRDGNAPFGIWAGEQMWALSGWTQGESFNGDVAAVVVAPNQAGERLVEVVGGRGIAWNRGRDFLFQSFGYPAATPFTGEKLFVCESYSGGVVAQFGAPYMTSIGCDMTGGSSGGGWIIESTYVNSLNSAGTTDGSHIMVGPYFGNAVADLFDTAESYAVEGIPTPEPTPAPDQPTTHAVKLSLRLRNHLVVRGTMTAPGGYLPCTRSAPVVVQRKTANGWLPVKQDYTDADGSYRMRVKDRGGRYRVFSPAGSVDELNLCAAVTTVVKRHSH